MTLAAWVWDPQETTLASSVSAGATEIEVNADIDVGSTISVGLEIVTLVGKITATIWQVGALVSPHFRGATVSGCPHRIIVGSREYTAVARNLRTSEACPGGEIEATWELDTSVPEAWLPSIDDPVLISDDVGGYWSGLLARPSIIRRDDGSCHIVCTARGFIVTAGWDGYATTRTFDAFTAGHTIVEDTRDELCPLISSSNEFVIDGGLSISQELECVGQSARQIWDRILQAGDLDGPLDLLVRTDDDNAPKLHLILREREPTIKVPWSSIANISLAWDAESERTKVVVKWRDGYAYAYTPGATVTRWLFKDFSAQIDNLALAQQLANQYRDLSILQAICEQPIVIEYPKQVFDADDNPIPIWRIRAGWLVQFVDDELVPLDPWNAELPIDTPQIKATDCDHTRHTNSLQLGARLDSDLDLAAQFTGRQMSQIAPAPASGIIPQFVTPPEGVPTGTPTGLVASGSGGHIGYDKVANDADMSTIWVAINELDTDTGFLKAGRLKNDVPIDVRMLVRGFRLRAGATTTDDPGTLSITIGHGTDADYPAAGTTIGTIAVSAAFSAVKNLPEDDGAGEHVVEIAPTDYLSITVDDSPAPDLVIGATLGILVQRTEGSSREGLADTPAINSVSASRDGDNNTTFLVTTDRVCNCQIEYGVDTNYGSRTRKTSELLRVSSITQGGLPADCHWRAHVFDKDQHETVGSDQTV